MNNDEMIFRLENANVEDLHGYAAVLVGQTMGLAAAALRELQLERDELKANLASTESKKEHWIDAWSEVCERNQGLINERDQEKWLRDRAEDLTNAVEDQRDKAMAERDALQQQNDALAAENNLFSGYDALKAENERLRAMPDVDTLAQIIRAVDGNNDLGAGMLAEAILARIGKEAE